MTILLLKSTKRPEFPGNFYEAKKMALQPAFNEKALLYRVFLIEMESSCGDLFALGPDGPRTNI